MTSWWEFCLIGLSSTTSITCSVRLVREGVSEKNETGNSATSSDVHHLCLLLSLPVGIDSDWALQSLYIKKTRAWNRKMTSVFLIKQKNTAIHFLNSKMSSTSSSTHCKTHKSSPGLSFSITFGLVDQLIEWNVKMFQLYTHLSAAHLLNPRPLGVVVPRVTVMFRAAVNNLHTVGLCSVLKLTSVFEPPHILATFCRLHL